MKTRDTPKSRPKLDAARIPKRPNMAMISPQQHRAQQLYLAGVRQVYSEGGAGKIYGAWAIGALLGLSAVNIYTLRWWDTRELHGMSKWQRQFVGGANRISMMTLVLIGGFAVFRYTGSIRSIRLFNAGPQGVLFDVRIRRRVPWSGTRYMVEPGDMLMPRFWRSKIRQKDSPTNFRRDLSNKLGPAYAWIKSWILKDSVIAPVRLSQETAGFMDATGDFDIPVDDFWAMTSEGRFKA
jgi:hypothetical protein